MAKLSELQSKVTGSAINVDPLGKKRPTTQTVFNTLQQSVSQSAAPSPRISKTTAPSSLPESKGKKVTLPTVKQKTNPLTTPAKSGFLKVSVFCRLLRMNSLVHTHGDGLVPLF